MAFGNYPADEAVPFQESLDVAAVDAMAAGATLFFFNAAGTEFRLSLPATDPSTKFMRGDGAWAVPAGGGGGGGAPDPHNATHISGGTDTIPVATASNTGLAPILSTNARSFLDGTGAYSVPGGWTILAAGADYEATAGERIMIADGAARNVTLPDPTGLGDGESPVLIYQAEPKGYNSINSATANIRPLGSTTDVTTIELPRRKHISVVWDNTATAWRVMYDFDEDYLDTMTAAGGHGIGVGDFCFINASDQPVKATNATNEPAPLRVVHVDGNEITFSYRRMIIPAVTWDIDPLLSGANDRYAYVDSSGDLSATIPLGEIMRQAGYFLKQSPYNAADAWFADVRNHTDFNNAPGADGFDPEDLNVYASDAAAVADVALAAGDAYLLDNGPAYVMHVK